MCQQRISKGTSIPYARVMIETDESGALKSSAKAEFTAIEPTTFMHKSKDDCGKDIHEPSDDKVIAVMTIVVIAVTRGRLRRKQRRMCAHS